MNILVVDDDAGFLQGLEIGLSQHGHQTISARCVAQMLKNLSFCLEKGICIHLMMAALPTPDAIGVSLVFAAREIIPALPCILIASDVSHRLFQKIARIPACGCLIKPFTPRQLMREMGQVLSQSDHSLTRHANKPFQSASPETIPLSTTLQSEKCS